jgi:hypothetical protein
VTDGCRDDRTHQEGSDHGQADDHAHLDLRTDARANPVLRTRTG